MYKRRETRLPISALSNRANTGVRHASVTAQSFVATPGRNEAPSLVPISLQPTISEITRNLLQQTAASPVADQSSNMSSLLGRVANISSTYNPAAANQSPISDALASLITSVVKFVTFLKLQKKYSDIEKSAVEQSTNEAITQEQAGKVAGMDSVALQRGTMKKEPDAEGDKSRLHDEIDDSIDEVRRKRDKMCSTLRDLRAELAKYEREYSQLKHRKRHDDPLLKENRIVQSKINEEIVSSTRTMDQLNDKIREHKAIREKMLDKEIHLQSCINTMQHQLHSPTERRSVARSKSSERVDRQNESATESKKSKRLEHIDTEDDKIENEQTSTKLAKACSNVACGENFSSSGSGNHNRSVFYDYFDPGSHYCIDCNCSQPSAVSMMQHLHSHEHSKHITPLRPWADKQRKSLRRRRPSSSVYETRVVPIKGVEFIVPIMGYYCNLCEALVGDPLAGEQHLKSDMHRERYQKHLQKHVDYEKNLLDCKAAAISSAMRSRLRGLGGAMFAVAHGQNQPLITSSTQFDDKMPGVHKPIAEAAGVLPSERQQTSPSLSELRNFKTQVRQVANDDDEHSSDKSRYSSDDHSRKRRQCHSVHRTQQPPALRRKYRSENIIDSIRVTEAFKRYVDGNAGPADIALLKRLHGKGSGDRVR